MSRAFGAPPRRIWAVALVLLAVPVCLLVTRAPAPARAADVAAARAVDVRPDLSTTDQRDARQMLANLAAWPPQMPLVVLVGGSAFRESTVSDAAFSQAVGDLVGSPVEAYNLSSSMRTFSFDAELIRLLPPVPTIVFIGVNEVRYAHAASDPLIELPPPVEGWRQTNWHKYDGRRILAKKRKRALARDWMRRGYPLFKRRYRGNQRQLRELVEACLARGFHPVLLNAPRDRRIVRRTLDRPWSTYRRGCGAIVREYGVPFIDLNRTLAYRDRDFQDLWHLRPSGRTKWQGRLAERAARLLLRYEMTGTPEYTDAVR